jgi:hypothetical protein
MGTAPTKQQKAPGVCPFAHKGIDELKKLDGTVVAQHIRFFSNTDDSVDGESMKAGHDVQSITAGVALKIRAITNMLFGKPSTVHTLAIAINPARTGLWDEKGNFDESVLQEIALLSNMYKDNDYMHLDKKIITREMFDQYLATKHGCKDLGAATKVFGVVPVSWKAITSASLDELVTYYGDAEHEGKKAITVGRIREFYTDPAGAMQRQVDASRKPICYPFREPPAKVDN